MSRTNQTYNEIEAQGPLNKYSTGSLEDDAEGMHPLTSITGVVELSKDQGEVTYSDFGWTRPAATYNFALDGVAFEISIDALTVSQPSPVTAPVEPIETDDGEFILTAGLTPAEHLSFSQDSITGTWNIGGGNQAGSFRLPLDSRALTFPIFQFIGVFPSGAAATGTITSLRNGRAMGKVGGDINYGGGRRLFKGHVNKRTPIELTLSRLVDDVQVTGRLAS